MILLIICKVNNKNTVIMINITYWLSITKTGTTRVYFGYNIRCYEYSLKYISPSVLKIIILLVIMTFLSFYNCYQL